MPTYFSQYFIFLKKDHKSDLNVGLAEMASTLTTRLKITHLRNGAILT